MLQLRRGGIPGLALPLVPREQADAEGQSELFCQQRFTEHSANATRCAEPNRPGHCLHGSGCLMGETDLHGIIKYVNISYTN